MNAEYSSFRAACLLTAAAVLGRAHAEAPPAGKADLMTVKKRIYASRLPAADDTRTATQAAGHAKSISPDGTWKDVDYRSRQPSSWPAARHLGRLRVMAGALRQPGGEMAGNAGLKAATLRGLDHWLKKDYRNPNWWWNEIGVPMQLGQVLVLVDRDLTPAQRAAGVRIMKRSRIGKTGQNLVWLAGNQVVWGCLAGDAKAVESAFKRMAAEIKVAGGDREGVKPDWSFWQHGRCLYSGGYGKGFSCDGAYFAMLAAGTRFAFAPEKIGVLSSYILDGQQWTVRGRALDYGTIGREISRPGAGRTGTLIQACRYMLKLKPPREKEFADLLDRLENGPEKARAPLVGNRHFWRSDFMTHHRKGWYASARMFSSRVDNTDTPCNQEGLLSHHIADGANFVMRRGDEYAGIFPVWDWRLVPGVTAEHPKGRLSGNPRSRGKQAFVGGVSDGEYGLAAMQLARGGLSAHKAWFFFDREYACLGAGITCKSKAPVLTSVNQCLLKGGVLSSAGKLAAGEHRPAAPGWVHHDGIGYVFGKGSRPVLRTGEQAGSWHRLRKASPKTPVKLDVFGLRLEHGAGPKGASYVYTVAPGVTAAEMPAYAKGTGVEVLSNTSALQAVRHAKLGIIGAVFAKPGTVRAGDGLSLGVEEPCLLLVRTRPQLRVTASNPLNRPLKLKVTVSLPGGAPRTFTLDLPGGEKAGSSTTLPARNRR